MNIPLSPFDKITMKRLGTPFLGLGEFLQRFFPNYKLTLDQADFGVNADEYFSIALFLSFFYGAILAAIFTIFLFFAQVRDFGGYGLLMGAFLAFMIFFRMVLAPKLYAQRRAREIDANLIFGLKVLLVELKAGVNLFESLVIVSSSELGELGSAFKEISKRLNSGEKEEVVLKSVASRNPSPFLSKILWEIVSGLKAGAPIAQVIEESLDSLERQQKTDIINYGSALRVLTLVFMMVAVIVPAMGLTFLSVLNSLPGVSFGSPVFIIVLLIVIIFQFMLIGFIKSRRPSLMGGA